MKRKKYIIQCLTYPLQSYVELSDSEVALIKFLIDEGFIPSETEIINLDDMDYKKLD